MARCGVQVMDCRQAQSLMALMVGQDHGDSQSVDGLERHVEHCAACQKFHQDLQVSQSVLQEARLQVVFRRRVWPSVAARLSEAERTPRFARFNVWVPTAVATAACLLLVSVALFEVQRRNAELFPGMAWQGSPSRDLFQTDPQFSASHGNLPSEADFERWLNRPGQPVPTQVRDFQLRTARNPAAW